MRHILKFMLTVIIFAGILGLGVTLYYHRSNEQEGTPVYFTIDRGENLKNIAERLAEKKVIRLPYLFTLLGRYLGKDRHIQSGEYQLNTTMSPQEVFHHLIQGHVLFHTVTFPEGITVDQIGRILEEKGLAVKDEILKAAEDTAFLRQLGINATSLEGYLFPDTYTFPMGLSAKEMLQAMVIQFQKKYGRLIALNPADSGRPVHEVVTLASIIEKETSLADEKTLIASVLDNRLKKGMRLQCDPTVIYGIEDFDGNLTRRHLRSSKNPYNTYAHKGLPPGPICNPGLDSIKAALRPGKTTYLYFVSKNDGSHHFSSSLKEHNQAVRTYQKRQ